MQLARMFKGKEAILILFDKMRGIISVFANTSTQARNWEACIFPLTLKECRK